MTPLPDPKSLARAPGPKCCRDPELKKWLDDLKELIDSGLAVESKDKLAEYAIQNGFDISATSIGRHLRGKCGTT